MLATRTIMKYVKIEQDNLNADCLTIRHNLIIYQGIHSHHYRLPYLQVNKITSLI